MKKYKYLPLILILLVLLFPFQIIALEDSDLPDGYSSNELIKNKSKIEVSIIDEKDKSLISDVKYEIQDENGNVLYEVTSTKEIYTIDELEEGNYYYVEKEISEEYELKKDKVSFVVNHEDDLVKVEIKHKSLSDSSKESLELLDLETTILVSVAMLDIAIGIGIIIYVKKNKDKK